MGIWEVQVYSLLGHMFSCSELPILCATPSRLYIPASDGKPDMRGPQKQRTVVEDLVIISNNSASTGTSKRRSSSSSSSSRSSSSSSSSSSSRRPPLLGTTVLVKIHCRQVGEGGGGVSSVHCTVHSLL